MQQYAQQGKKHEYWFAVPQERSVPVLHLFTKQDAQGILNTSKLMVWYPK